MRSVSISVVVANLVCALPAAAGPTEDALAVVAQWTAAFTASDVDAITKLYAPDALFIGTGSRAVVTEPAAVRAYFERALLTNRPRSARLDEQEITVLSETAVIVAGLDTVTSTRDGMTTSAVGRVTFVVARRGERWQIVHFHRSALP